MVLQQHDESSFKIFKVPALTGVVNQPGRALPFLNLNLLITL